MTTASPAEFGASGRSKPKRKRIEPLKALRAIRALIADKEDTGQVFKIIDALSGGANDRQFRHFIATETGQRIAAEKRDLIATLNKREWLSSLPEGTLGRSYYAFMAEENLTADGLVEASKEAPRRYARDENEQLFGDRLRDQHDLWHVTTGYGRDGLGELALLSFTYAQTRNRGIGFIVLVGARISSKRNPDLKLWRVVREGFQHGKRAKWLPATDWEAMLERPLDEVRALLGIEAPAAYNAVEPITSERERAFIERQAQKKAA
ncbi:Coq4 family protein [uncultured Parvibaculum sp.]|uniref:Coq4 family protein n=1 Tax=uncultured Parvibaculum sp. TaxID=291828 RepID=UPI0030D904D5|tara:strand:+ start:120375 stop:121169 length:795 start_codon:yes stop_codon:yes gene_type:complete